MPAVSTTSGVGFSVKVTEVSGLEFDADTRANVKKRIANILYLNDPPPDAVYLSYVGTNELRADSALHIGDRSDRLFPNSRDSLRAELLYNSSPVGVSHKNILVTQKFALSTATDIPLYYKHLLASTVQSDTIKILDKNFKELSPDHYLVELEKEYDESTGAPVDPVSYTEVAVYNSLESYFDYDTGDYEVYYLQYKDSLNDVKTVLLDNVPAYREALAEDLWDATGQLAPWARAYVLSSSSTGYQLTMPAVSPQKFSVKYTAQSKIQMDPPVSKNDTSLWLPRVTDGSFASSYGSLGYTYSIPEFTNQSFNPIEPYKLASRIQAVKIAEHLLKLEHDDIADSEVMQSLSVLIENEGEVIYALTQDSTLVGSRYRNFDGEYVYRDGEAVEWSSTELLSVDNRSGIVEISLALKDYWDYYATYNYLEKHLELSSLNMNPVYNREIHKQIRAVYIVPTSAANNNTGTQTQSVQSIAVDPSGIIEEVSQDGTGGNANLNLVTTLADTDASKISGLLGLHYSWRVSSSISASCTIGPSQAIYVADTSKFPQSGWVRIFDGTYWRYAEYESKTSTTLVLSATEVPNPPVSLTYSSSTTLSVQLVNFIDEFSTGSISSSTTEQARYLPSTGYPNCFSRYFVVAEMTVNPQEGIHDATVIDVRENGGGLDPDKYEEAKEKQPEAQWFNDYTKYDGQPYAGNAVVVIKLPNELLNTFTEEQIASIIDENIPYGVTPLIRYYGYTPNITYAGPSGIEAD